MTQVNGTNELMTQIHDADSDWMTGHLRRSVPPVTTRARGIPGAADMACPGNDAGRAGSALRAGVSPHRPSKLPFRFFES